MSIVDFTCTTEPTYPMFFGMYVVKLDAAGYSGPTVSRSEVTFIPIGTSRQFPCRVLVSPSIASFTRATYSTHDDVLLRCDNRDGAVVRRDHTRWRSKREQGALRGRLLRHPAQAPGGGSVKRIFQEEHLHGLSQRRPSETQTLTWNVCGATVMRYECGSEPKRSGSTTLAGVRPAPVMNS
jgi:hypothetical protein